MWFNRVLLLLFLLPTSVQAGEPAIAGMLHPSSRATMPMVNTLDLPQAGVFLVAPRAMTDPRFQHSIVYLVAHGQGGSLGLIVNRPGDIKLSSVVPDFPEEAAAKHALYFGGPVGLPMILLLARGETVPEGMERVTNDVYISSEQPVLEAALARSEDEVTLRFYIGYAGWGSGQLDMELAHNGWHIIAGDADTIFADDAAELWSRLIDKLEPVGIQAGRSPVLPMVATAASPVERH